MQHSNDGDEFAENPGGLTPEEQRRRAAERLELEEEERLAFADEDERLPWLESEDDYEDEGPDSSRIATMVIFAVLSLAAILGLAWWFSKPGSDEELLAEGSTITAPDEPYRTRPADPGGEPVDGTGDVGFAIGEAQAREGQVAAGPAPAPTPAATASASAAARRSIDRAQAGATPAASAAAAPPAAPGGVAVQVAAFSSRARAEQGWSELAGRYSALQGLQHRVVEASVDGATVFRLQALPGSVAAAETVCRSIRSAGGDCQVKR